MDSKFRIHGDFRFDKLSAVLSEKLRGQHVSEHNTIEGVRLTGDAVWLYTDLKVAGRFNGHMIAQFKLSTDPDSPSLVVDELNTRVEDGGIISVGANFILKHFLNEKLRLKVQQQIASSMTDVVKEMMSKYGSVEIDGGFILSTELESYNIEKISWDRAKLYCDLEATGVLRVTL